MVYDKPKLRPAIILQLLALSVAHRARQNHPATLRPLTYHPRLMPHRVPRCTSPALLAPRRLTSRLAVITTASKGKGPAASAPKKKGAAASSSSSSAKPPSNGASGAAAAATAGTAGAGAAAASHGNAHTVVVKAASAAVLTVEAEVSSVVTTRVVASRRRRISRGDEGHGMIIGDDDCDDECDSFAGGALGTGEIDVAVADSDEELDGSGGSEHIVPAGEEFGRTLGGFAAWTAVVSWVECLRMREEALGGEVWVACCRIREGRLRAVLKERCQGLLGGMKPLLASEGP